MKKMNQIKDFIYGALSLIGFGILFVCGLFIVAIIVAAFWAITIPFLIIALIISIFSLLLN
jgi:protein-S-isoprenylcysteine O-methyltransferase Ste14